MKNWIFSGLLLMMVSVMFSQQTVTGIVIDNDTRMGLPGVNVVVLNSTENATTDDNGKFQITTVQTAGSVEISYIGFETKVLTFKVANGGTANLGQIVIGTDSAQLDEIIVVGKGVIDLADSRRTPIAVSTIRAAEIKQKTGSADVTQAMVNTPSVYVAGQSGGFGDSRITVRGFGQDNTAFLLNGQPINGMEDGLVYWSNWSGMSDIANGIQIQRGLGSSKLAISSVGGTVNFVTKTTDKREGGFVSAGVANDNYLKTTAAYSTGEGKNGFGASVLLTRWQGDGYNDGTFGEGYNYFISLGYKLNESHNFNFLITGAPQEHDQNFSKTISSYLEHGRRFNNNWGTLNGQYLSERTNFYHKPVANLNWDWNINDNTSLSTVLYGSWGRGGGTGSYGKSAAKKYTADDQINFDAIYANNEALPNGDGTFGNNAYAIRSSMNNHDWYGLVTNLEKQLSENLTLNFGADLRTYKGSHYRQINNFLGLNSWTESRRLFNANSEVIPVDVFNTVTESQPINHFKGLFNSIDKDQRIDYDYSETISYGGVFGQVEYATEKFSVFAQGAASTQSHQRFDYYDYIAEAEAAEKVNNFGFNAKAGGSYNIADHSQLYVNAGYYSRQPYHDNIYLNYTNQVNPLTENEKILGFEAGYKFKSKFFTANVNAYRTSWKDRVVSSSATLTKDEVFGDITIAAGEQVYTTNEGVEQLHSGVELDFVAKPFSFVEVRAFGSVGNWEYVGDAVKTKRDEDRRVLESKATDVDGGKVGDAAQITAGVGAKFKIVERLSLDADYRFYDKLYSNAGAVKENLLLPKYDLVDAGISYRMLVGKDKDDSVDFRLNVNNVFYKVYLSELRSNIKTTDRVNPKSETDFSTYESAGKIYNGLADGNQGYFGLGRTWSFTISYNF
ncbi:TonB-dependent receptor [Flavobacterium ardleyense]|uniref:TonB-dependent receptor n=1 Tax=Flavobacterium ardleyense TaxID=2038737 RepID=UPI00298CB6A3|nr:TonB-dependent receptor [Flavobacterium ardleyense]